MPCRMEWLKICINCPKVGAGVTVTVAVAVDKLLLHLLSHCCDSLRLMAFNSIGGKLFRAGGNNVLAKRQTFFGGNLFGGKVEPTHSRLYH